jgi:orotate phosphoribosyltransferase
MLSKENVLDIFRRSKVLMEGHFLLTSGRHSHKYLQCARIFQHPEYSEQMALTLAEEFREDNIDMVVGPAIGGIVLSYEMARCLGVISLFTERENGEMMLRRGFEIPPDSRVLVVEDVITTGGSVQEVIDLVKRHGGDVVGVGAFVDRSGGKADFGTKFRTIISLNVESYAPEDCPLCKEGRPLIKPGSRDLPQTP